MGFFAMNATEDSLMKIASQMWFRNELDLLRELYATGAITKEEYAYKLQNLHKHH